MLIFLLVFFRVLHIKKVETASKNKITKADNINYGCDETVNDHHLFEEPGEASFNYYFKCENKDQFKIQHCTFKIHMHCKGFFGIEQDTTLLYFANVNVELLENIFEDCIVRPKIIHCGSTSNNYLNMYTNSFIKCHHLDSKKFIEVLSSYYQTNDIQNNNINFENHDTSSGRGFFIQKHKGCKFIGNHVTNANYDKESGGILFSEDGTGDGLTISHNVFTDCKGKGSDRGNVIKINTISYDLTIKNLTLEYCTSEHNSREGYLIRIKSTLGQAKLNFIDCNFSYLKCSGNNGGGIGLYFINSGSTHYSLYFENTIFQHLRFTNEKYGGGAISCSGNYDETKFTSLTVKGCTFNNISSNLGGGGAIYFNSRGKELIIENSHFISTYPSNNQEVGGAIFAQYYNERNKNHLMPVTIKDCTFLNTSSNKGGSIYIEYDTPSKSDAKISGCRFTNSKANTNGHSIYIDQSTSDSISIDHCVCVDCGSDSKTYSIFLDVIKLNFINNEIIFSNSNQNCGCVDLKIIGEHVFKGNIFRNAHNDNSIWNSACINCGIECSLTSILIENNTFDQIEGNNQGRCFYFISKGNYNNNVRVLNNTIKNCPPGGPLLKIWFQTQIYSFKIETCNFINVSVTDCYETIGPSPHLWFENTFDNEKNHINSFELTIENCRFEMNSNQRQGGGLSYGKIKYTANIKLILIGCHFIDNYAKQAGGALNIQTYQGCEIKNCEFKRNRSDEGCGSIYIETDFDCLKDLESDKTGVLPYPSTRNPTVSIVNSNFEDNMGKDSNAINIKNSINVPIDILQCDFLNCGTNGYAISIQTNVQITNLHNCTFNYTTDQTSGGIYNIHDKIILIGNTFMNFKETAIRFPCEQSDQPFQFIENQFISCQSCYTFYIEKIVPYQPIIRGNHFDYISGNKELFYIKLNDNINSFTFENNSFTNFNIDSDFGGISFDVSHENNNVLLKYIFNDCVFINDKNSKLGGALLFDSKQNARNTILSLEGCYFCNNNNDDKKGSLYINIKNDILIDDCHFSENSISNNGILYIEQNSESDTAKTQILISNCHFQQNQGQESSIYLASGQIKTLKIESCKFEQDYGGIFIDDFNNQVELLYNTFSKTNGKTALMINVPTKSQNKITVEYCIFDDCRGSNIQCFDIKINTKFFSFNHNIVQNNVGNRYDNYFGSLDCNEEIITYELSNITFINNKCKSLYGGGTGLQLKKFQQITFDECLFINNVALQDTSESRPTKGSSKYYNGDGGGFQIGYYCTYNSINLIIQDCKFINNSAYRHGGAIAIQTLGLVKITRCIFENNKANCNSEKSELLIENHFDKKYEGRGGAIYINPSYEYEDTFCRSPTHFMNSVEITKCEFKNNNGYDGYAMYFEGDDPGSTFAVDILDNVFTDNYNEKNHNDDIYSIYGAVITTEINKITEEQVSKDNIFNYTITEIKLHNISFVDHYGKTPSKAFTLSDSFTKSDVFPSNFFTKSEMFSGSLMFSKTDGFSASSDFTASEIVTPLPSQEFTASKQFSNSNKFTNSYQFSKSDKFSKTEFFSKSSQFSKSNEFSKSSWFSKSNIFTKSNQFSSSNKFSNSNQFSESKQFSATNMFTVSNQFSKSNLFSNSNQFSSSLKFSETNYFSKSNIFSVSNQFTKSDIFSNSNKFSSSGLFSQSLDFSKSKLFSSSNSFSYSNEFSKSNQFSRSDIFTNSNQFSRSQLFTSSKEFSSTNQFSNSDLFSVSKQFSKSNCFTNSIGFRSTEKFTKSNLFSNSKEFSETEKFSKTDYFSKSNQFTKSDIFSNSNKFSSSGLFSQSNEFSKSKLFSSSNSFSYSNEFSKSNQFTKSDIFTSSNQFSRSQLFTSSKEFSSTNQFSNSDLFSVSKQFSKSNCFTNSIGFRSTEKFTKSNLFSNSKEFSETEKFSKTDYFSKSNTFSISNQFTKSDMFTNSNQFSSSVLFTQSLDFSKSKQFSSTNMFSSSNSFSYSDQFSKSNPFSKSYMFTSSNKFSSTGKFSQSIDFSKSKLFSSSNSFSYSDQFSKSNQFSKSKSFSQSKEFSNSKQFSSTNMFSSSEKFSNSNKFSKSDLFSKSNDFTSSTKFSNTHYFTQSNDFTKSNQFSQSGQFSQSKSFSKSNQFSQSSLFSSTKNFTSSNKFSNSDQFTKTSLFSQSTVFSNSNHFSETNTFSISSLFTSSEKFSITSKFSTSNQFSLSKDFSNSNKFSESGLFSKSNDFTESNSFRTEFTYHFTKSDMFSSSNLFSNSGLFSRSSFFSKSDLFNPTGHFTQSRPFSKSSQFSQTNYFTQTKSFTETHHFTSSNLFTKSRDFTESAKFKETAKFSQSNDFSKSFEFTISAPFENKEPQCILYEDGEEILLNECNFSMIENKNALIKVILTNFTHMNKNNINGTAIHIENCGFECNRTLFFDCVTSKGCGGAIYIRNIFDITNNITFEDLTFISCKANCGGAIFVHSEKEESYILIRNCTFITNEVYKKGHSNSFSLFGGSAAYISSNDVNIIDCTFNKNIGSGGTVKIEQIPSENKRIRQLGKIIKPIRISGCSFENVKKSGSSIIYENNDNQVEIIECNFKGKLKKGSHYIDGNIIDKEKLQIKNCKFEYDTNVTVSTYQNNHSINNYIQNSPKVVICTFIIISAFGLIIVKLTKSKYNEKSSDSFDSDDFSNQLIINNLESL